MVVEERVRSGRRRPGCGGSRVPWVLGMPDPELVEADGWAEVVLGGCRPSLGCQRHECGAPPGDHGCYAPVDREHEPGAAEVVPPTDGQIRQAESVARRVASGQLRGREWEGIGVADVVQEVLLRFAQLDLAQVANPDAWVTTATRNRCADVRAAVIRHDQRPIEGSPVADAVTVDEVRDVVMAVVGPSGRVIARHLVAHVLADLSERERKLLVSHGDGWSNAELAEQFGYANAQSAAVAISRAKQKVRRRFATPSQRADLLDPQRSYPVL